MVPKLDKHQVASACKKGARSAVKTMDSLYGRIADGKGRDSDIQQYTVLYDRVMKLIGQGAEPTPGTLAPGEPKDAEQERQWIKAIEEGCHPYVEAYDRKEISMAQLREMCMGVIRQVTGTGELKGPTLERISNMRKFKAQRKCARMFSKKLNKEIGVISTPDQRSAYEEAGIAVYTIDEAIVLSLSDLERDVAGQKAVDVVKTVFDGELIGVN